MSKKIMALEEEVKLASWEAKQRLSDYSYHQKLKLANLLIVFFILIGTASLLRLVVIIIEIWR